MKKLVLCLALVFGFTMTMAPAANAVDVDFLVSASIPAANGISIVATEVDANSNVFGSTVNALDFDSMAFNSNLGVWLPDHYFAIDVGVTGGAGSADVTVSYNEGAIPNGQTKGLGWKSTATFVKITGPNNAQVETELVSHGPKRLLTQLESSAEQLTGAELLGGFLRVYVGIFPGDDQTLINLGGEPFTNSDVPGTYDGTLTISATVA